MSKEPTFPIRRPPPTIGSNLPASSPIRRLKNASEHFRQHEHRP